MAKVAVVKGPDRGRVFRLKTDQPQIVGRKGVPLLLSDAQSSRNHAEFFKKDGHWYIKDMGSANGTLVNREKISRPVHLHHGDTIRVGMTQLVFKRSSRKHASSHTGSSEKPTVQKSPKALSPENLTESELLLTEEDGFSASNNDASSLMLEILDDIISETESDTTIAEYIPDYDPLNPKTHRVKNKNKNKSNSDAPTVVPTAETTEESQTNQTVVAAEDASGETTMDASDESSMDANDASSSSRKRSWRFRRSKQR